MRGEGREKTDWNDAVENEFMWSREVARWCREAVRVAGPFGSAGA
jgi:hypothetical protein